jgi:hypothetical protein
VPDLSDVEAALAAAVAGAVYPKGAEGAPAPGLACRVYRGWPTAAALEADLAAGIAHVTVQSMPAGFRDMTRFLGEWQGAAPPVTLTATVAGETVTFAGDPAPGQVAGVRVDGVPHAYRVRQGDTPGVIAAVLAALIRTVRPAELHGDGILLPGGLGIVARVADGVGGTELRRQRAGFRVTAWCPDPASRDRVAGCVDGALAAIQFLDVGGWGCWLRLSGGSVLDAGSVAGVWRRDLLYGVEYPTVVDSTLPSMLFGVAWADGVATVV